MTAAVALPRRSPPDPRQLQRCLVLAVLLHVWLVLVFGNATGTAAPGQGVWGSLSVKLMGPSGGAPNAPPGNPAPEWRDNGAPGQNTQQRRGGQVRAVEPPPSDTPGAAELGRWNPQPVPAEAARTEALSPAPPSTATLALPEGFRPIEREDLSTPARRIAPPESSVLPLQPADVSRPDPAAPLPTPAAELPAAVGRLESAPERSAAPLPSPASLRPAPRTAALPPLPTDLPAPISRLEAAPTAALAPALARPSELRAAPAPARQALPNAELPTTAVQRLEAPAPGAAAAVTPLARPSDLRTPSTPTAAQATPLPNAQDLPAAVRRLESADSAVAPLRPAQTARVAAPAAAQATPLPNAQDLPAAVRRLESADSAVAPLRPAQAVRVAAPPAAQATTLPSAQDLPAAVRRLESADSAVAPLQPAQAARVAAPAPGSTAPPDLSNALPGQVAAPAAAPAGPARGDPNANPNANTYAAPKASAGSPDAGSRLGRDLAVPPSAAASAPRAPLNLSLPRGGDIAARRGTGLIELLPQPPERKSKLERSVEEAANADCRKAYDNAGLLAVVPLAIDAARGKGCKW